MGGVISKTEFRIADLTQQAMRAVRRASAKRMREAPRTSDDVQGQSIESSIIRPAIERARRRTKELLRASPYGDDQTVAEAFEQFDLITEEGTRRQVGGLATQLSANMAVAGRLRGQSNASRNNTLVAIAFVGALLAVIVGAGTGSTALMVVILLLLVGGLLIVAAPSSRASSSAKELELVEQEIHRLGLELDAKLEAEWVRPIVTRVLDSRDSPTFSSTLQADEVLNFGGPSDHPIETDALRQLRELVAGSDGASIGLCGTRGVGKTTLIREFCRSSAGITSDGQTIGIWVDVPVAYAQLDFLKTTYARLLTEVQRRVVTRHPSQSALRGRSLWRRGIVQFLVVAAVLAAGALTREKWLDRVKPIIGLEPEWLRATVLLTALGLAMYGTTTLVIRRSLNRSRTVGQRANKPFRISELVEQGFQTLEADVATSSTIGGSFVLFGSGLQRSGTRQVSRGPISYPALVDEFRACVSALADMGLKVRIGIDELDKLDSDDARSFLNGLKAVFGLPHTHFLVSVSEEAMSDFERRGVPIRDAFDSSLDEVLRVERLTIDQSMRLLASRGDYAFPLSFGALCHCLSGGLPRDLLRVARKLVRHNARLKGKPQFGLMKYLCWNLIEDDLTAKSHALWIVARNVGVEPYGMRFRSWLAVGDENRQSPERLLSTCEAYLGFPVVDPHEITVVPEWLSAIERLGALGLEYVGYRYFAVTLVDFFSRAADVEFRRSLGDDAGSGTLETLSAARRRFADDPRLAWSLVSQFRQAHRISPALPVPAEGWRLP